LLDNTIRPSNRRFLALVGGVNLIMIFNYDLPLAIIAAFMELSLSR
jgi:hypothetical protein